MPQKNQRKKQKSALAEFPASMPKQIKPMLAYLAPEVFDSKQWLFENKWDGYRAIAEVNHNNVSLYSRTFQSFNERYFPIVKALQKLHLQIVLDGEIIILGSKGKASFQDLQNYQKNIERGKICYCIFDILYLEGRDLRALPLLERKQILDSLKSKFQDSTLLLTPYVLNDGKKLFQIAKKKRREGLIAKDIGSPYVSQRSRNWLKIKTHQRQEALICGFTSPSGSRQLFGALILGIYHQKHLRYCGHVGTGFTRKILKEVMDQIEPFITNKCPFEIQPLTNAPVTWVKPKLLCEVSFAEWTKEKVMRQPVFQGLRSDKKAEEVKQEQALPKLTNLTKVFWKEEGYTKGDLLEYYSEIAPYLLPYLKDRPETLHRYPNGITGTEFYQKNITEKFPDWLQTCEVEYKGEKHRYLLIPDKASLLFSVNLGCIDFHPFHSRISNLHFPDYLILDLDPVNISFDRVIETAQMIHEFLEPQKIPCFCKTSGSRGLHIFIPLGAKYSDEQVKMFSQLLAEILHEQLPSITSLKRNPRDRQGKVYIDYLQNGFGKTVAAPYCVRPKPGATVSTPLEWSEVKKGLDPSSFTIKNMMKRLKKKGDLFTSVISKGINLESFLKKLQK